MSRRTVAAAVLTLGFAASVHAQNLVNGTYQFTAGTASIDGGFACFGSVPAVQVYPNGTGVAVGMSATSTVWACEQSNGAARSLSAIKRSNLENPN
jgi:hypothetical protein